MSWAIKIDGLGKKYHRGQIHPLSNNLRESIVCATKTALHRLALRNGRPSGSLDCRTRIATEEFWALRDINLEIQQGEIVGVIGRNGAGKSTLLKILARITPPTCGSIRYRGRIASLLEIGTGFHRELTGRENIYLNGSILGMRRSEIRKRFDEIVDFSGVADFIDTPVKFYSSGMYVRLAFAVAAYLESDILLIDEVLAVGDASFRNKCIGKMNDVSAEGRTILFVSHNMGALSSLCGRSVVLDSGRQVYEGISYKAVQHYFKLNVMETSIDWDLSSASRTKLHLGEIVQLKRIQAFPEDSNSFHCGEALKFRISFKTRNDLPTLSCALGIDDIYGSRVVTFESDVSKIPISLRSGENYEISLKVSDLKLLPGNYLLSASLYAGQTYLDYLIHFGCLVINPTVTKNELYIAADAGKGVIYCNPEWQILKCA